MLQGGRQLILIMSSLTLSYRLIFGRLNGYWEQYDVIWPQSVALDPIDSKPFVHVQARAADVDMPKKEGAVV